MLHLVTDKQARSSSDGHLNFGAMIRIPSSNGQITSRHHCYFGSLASGLGQSSNGQKTPSACCYYEYQALVSHRILESEVSSVIFLKTFCHGRKLRSLRVEAKILSTPIESNRVYKFLSSTVDSYWLWTLRIFNIVSLHFGERGATNLLLSVTSLGH
jgi:hypothetical protein